MGTSSRRAGTPGTWRIRGTWTILVEGVPVEAVAVVEELVAMIGGDHQQGLVPEAPLLEAVDQAADVGVGVAQDGAVAFSSEPPSAGKPSTSK
ncbi:MAG: hypothetical protein R3F60_26145 [bacterium]